MNVVITGANRGIGLSLTKQYAAKGYKVYCGCRNPGKAKELFEIKGVEKVFPLDLSSDESIHKFAQSLGNMPIHLLINNAGILVQDNIDTFTTEEMQQQYRVNAVGPIELSRCLLKNLEAADSPKLILMTSRVGSMGDNSSGNLYGYRASKAALNSLGKSFAINLEQRKSKIAVILLHPGHIQTEMTGNTGDIGPDECAAKLYETIAGLTIDQSGKFIHRDGFELPW